MLDDVPLEIRKAAAEEGERTFDALFDPREIRVDSPHLHAITLQGKLPVNSSILRLVLHPAVLRKTSDYIGMVPILAGIWILYSPNARVVEESSQFFHFDNHDLRTVKLFLHIKDVDPENGPLNVVAAESSGRVAREVHYRKVAGRKRLRDDEVFTRIDSQRDVLTMTGQSGTAYLVDTDRCLHMGSREGKRPRLVLEVLYLSPFALQPPEHAQNSPPFAALIGGARTQVERLVLAG